MVYTELLDFGGDEIYFNEEPALSGKTYKESIFMYEDSAIIGIALKNGRTRINPPMDTVIQEGDKIIAISENDDTVVLSGLKGYDIVTSAISSGDLAHFLFIPHFYGTAVKLHVFLMRVLVWIKYYLCAVYYATNASI